MTLSDALRWRHCMSLSDGGVFAVLRTAPKSTAKPKKYLKYTPPRWVFKLHRSCSTPRWPISTCKYQREKIQPFCFYIKMKKRLKTSQAISFLIENQKFHYPCSVNWLSRTCRSTFLRFFEARSISEEKYSFFVFTTKWKNPSKPSKKSHFWKYKKNIFLNRKSVGKPLSFRLF